MTVRTPRLLLLGALALSLSGCADEGTESVDARDDPSGPVEPNESLVDLAPGSLPSTAVFSGTLIAGDRGVFCADGAESAVPVCDRFQVVLPVDVAAAAMEDVRATNPGLVQDQAPGAWARDVTLELSGLSIENLRDGESAAVVSATSASFPATKSDAVEVVEDGSGQFVPAAHEDPASAATLANIETTLARSLGPTYVSTTAQAGEVEVRTVLPLDAGTRQAIGKHFGGPVRFISWGTVPSL